jgi:hypothetical protein
VPQRSITSTTLSWSPQARQVFGEFIDQASRLFADALTHQLDDPSKPAPLYEAMGKVRLRASNEMDDWLGLRSHFLPIQELLRTQLPARPAFRATLHEQTPRGPYQ